MKRIPWLGIGAVVLLVGAYVVFFVKVSPDRSRAEPRATLRVDPPVEPYQPDVIEIAWSDPLDGYIDVGQVTDADQYADGIRQIAVRFNTAVTLTVDRIEVVTTGDSAPLVESVTPSGDHWIIDLDRPIPAAESTAIVFDAGVAWVLIHSHPGDVNLDGTTDWNDAIALDAAIEARWTEVTGYDVNRDGQVSSADVDSLAGVIAFYNGTVWNVESLGQVLCCCVFDRCSVAVGSSCAAGGEVSCPCVPNPCVSVSMAHSTSTQ